MKPVFLVLFAAAALSALADEAAAEGVATATLQSPLAKPVNVIAGDAYWTCSQALCAADGHTASALTAEVRPNPEADPAGQHYEAWRSAIRAGIAARKGNASC